MPPQKVHIISAHPRYDALNLLQKAKCEQFLQQNSSLTPETYEIFAYNCAFQEFLTAFGPESDYCCGDYNIHHESTKTSENGYNTSYIRSIYWRLYLQVFGTTYSPILWTDLLDKQRQHHNQLTQRYTLPFHPITNKIDLTLLTQDSAITPDNIGEYIALCDTIKLDLIRTYPSCGYYTHTDTQDQLLNILYLWCCEHQEAYKQGMNELAALLLYTFSYDSTNTTSRQNQLSQKMNKHHSLNSPNPTSLQEKVESLEYTFSSLLNRDYILHDVYFAFSAVMRNMGQYYSVNAASQAQHRTISTSGSALLSHHSSSFSPLNPATSPPLQQVSLSSRSGATGNMTNPSDGLKQANSDVHIQKEPPIVVIASHIFHALLPIYDPDLYRHLTEIDVIPTLFLLRWVRLLFTREFASLDESSILHDSLFSTTQSDFSLLPYIAIAMIHLKREDLLQADDTSSAFEFLLRSQQNEWWSDDDEEEEEEDNHQHQYNDQNTPTAQNDQLHDLENGSKSSSPPTPLSKLGSDLFSHDDFTKPQNDDMFDANNDDDLTELFTRPRGCAHSITSLPTDIESRDSIQSISPSSLRELTSDNTDKKQKEKREKREKREKPLSICKRSNVSSFPSQIVQLAHKLSRKVVQLPKTGKPFTTSQLQQIAAQSSGDHTHPVNLRVPPPPSKSKAQYSGTDYDRSEFGVSSGRGKKSGSSGGSKGLFGFVSKIGQALDGGPKQTKSTPSSSIKSPGNSSIKVPKPKATDRDIYSTNVFEQAAEYTSSINLTTEMLLIVNDMLSGVDTADLLAIKNAHSLQKIDDLDSSASPTAQTTTNDIVLNQTTPGEAQSLVVSPDTTPIAHTNTPALSENIPPLVLVPTTISQPITVQSESPSQIPLPSSSSPLSTALPPEAHLFFLTASVPISKLFELQQKLTQLQDTLEVLSKQQTSIMNISPQDDYFKTSSTTLAQLGTTSVYSKNIYSAYGHEDGSANGKSIKFDTHGFAPTPIKKDEITINDDVGFDGISIAIPSATANKASNNSQFNTRQRGTALSSENLITPTNENQKQAGQATKLQNIPNPSAPSTPSSITPRKDQSKSISSGPGASIEDAKDNQRFGARLTSPIASGPPKSSTSTRSTNVNKNIVNNAQLVSMALFDDDEDEVVVPVAQLQVKIIEPTAQSTPITPAAPVPTPPTQALTQTEPIVRTQTKKSKIFKPNQKGLLFGSDSDNDCDEDDDVGCTNTDVSSIDTSFFITAAPLQSQPVPTPTPTPTPSSIPPATSTSISKKSELFDSLNDGKKKPQPVARGLFDDDTDDIFSSAPQVDVDKYASLFE